MVTLAVSHGFGRHARDVTEPDAPQIIMYDYLAQAFGFGGGTLGRIAFIVFIVGILGIKRSHRIILWCLVALQLIINFVFVLIILIQCSGHASAIWANPGKAKCWDFRVQSYYGYFQGCED